MRAVRGGLQRQNQTAGCGLSLGRGAVGSPWGGVGLAGGRPGTHSKPVSPCLAGGTGEREKVPASPEALLLMASSQRDMEDWVQAIRRVIWAPFGGGTARSSHAHPLEPLPSGNHALCPPLSRTTPLPRDSLAVSPAASRRLAVSSSSPASPPGPQADPGRGIGAFQKYALLPPESCHLCVLASLRPDPCWALGVCKVVCTVARHGPHALGGHISPLETMSHPLLCLATALPAEPTPGP